MNLQGRVSLRDLEKKSFETTGEMSPLIKDAWVKLLLEKAAPSKNLVGVDPEVWAERANLRVSVYIEKVGVGKDYVVRGTIEGQVSSPCSRCGDPFAAARKGEFNLVMHRVVKGEAIDDEDSGDPDYIYFEADDIDLPSVLAEQVIILEPYAECPAQEPDGNCTLCHLNPKFDKSENSTRQEVENSAFSALSKLTQLKAKKES